MKDPWGREIFWIGGGTITWTGERTPIISRWRRASSRSRRCTWISPTTRCSRRFGDGRWRGRGGGQLRRLPRPSGGDAPAEGNPRPRRAARGPNGAPPPLRPRERAPPGVRRRGAPDRQRPDDLAALGPGALPGAARADRPGAGAGDRHRLRLSDRAAGAASQHGLQRGADPGAGSGRPGRARGCRNPERHRAGGRRHPRLAPVRPVRRDPGGGGVARGTGAAGGAAGARRPHGHPAGRSSLPDADPGRTAGDGVRTSTIADVRFVPLLGEFGFRQE